MACRGLEGIIVKMIRVMTAVVVLAAVGGVAYMAKEKEPAGGRMADAAQKFLDGLTAEQKAKATFGFDDKERTNWIFIPVQDKERRPGRKGLRLEEMSDDQKKAVLELLKTGTSDSGFKQAVTIMSLEALLRDLEKNGAMVRNPGWYFVSIFGTPAKTGKWGWRIEGHHMSLNFTVADGKIQSATPAFFGSNPAEIKFGDRKGERILPEVEDLARGLFQSLDEDQKKVVLQPKHFGEPTAQTPAEKVGKPIGLSAAKMTEAQKAILMKLLKAYTNRMTDDVAQAQWKSIADGGVDAIHFAYTGSTEPGKGYTYRVQGPTFIVQFLNVQEDSAKNPANHIHSAWRELPSDFGL
jgi:hypothetical protein